MKNYSEEFSKTYNQVFEEYEKQQKRKKFLRQVIVVPCNLLIVFTAIVISRLENEQTLMDVVKTSIQMPLIWIIGISVGVLISGFYQQFKILKTDIYEEKARDFATTIYFDDLILILSSRFTLSQEFKDKLKAAMADLYWYDNGFVSESTIEFDEEFPELKMTMADDEYYLAGVAETKTGFLVECKIIAEGKTKTVEFLLPASEN